MLKVLIVDDDEEFLEELAEMVVSSGYETHKASSVDGAIGSADEIGPDLILLDLRMPGDGDTLVRTFRENGKTSRTPIVVVSGHVGDEERESLSSEFGIDTFLEKPVDPSDLIETIERYEID